MRLGACRSPFTLKGILYENENPHDGCSFPACCFRVCGDRCGQVEREVLLRKLPGTVVLLPRLLQPQKITV
jgi:hypothetical protein